MAVNPVEAEILELAEEDFYGVWEVGWRLVTALGVDPSSDPRLAAEAIASLKRQGRVDIYVREWIDDTPRQLALSGRSIDLNDASAWLEPQPGQPQFLIGVGAETSQV